MASEKTLNALKKIATFGTSVAAESAYNKYKTEKDTETFEKSLNTLLPGVMDRTNTNPAKMASAYNVGGQGRIISNLDTTMQTTIDTASNYAALDPGSYNKQLAQNLMPSVNAIKSLKGAERSVAMSRLEKQIQVAQSNHMLSNKAYTQTQTKNVLSNNINVTLDMIIDDKGVQTTEERVAAFDEQLSSLLLSNREKGLPDLDAQKLINDIFVGRVAEGSTKVEEIYHNTKFKSFINPMTMRAALSKGKQAMLDRYKSNTQARQLTKAKEEEIVINRIQQHLATGQSIESLVVNQNKFVNGISDNLYKKMFLSNAGQVNLTGDPTKDADIYKEREKITKFLAAELSTGKDKQDLKNRLNEHTAHLGSVIDAIDAGVTQEWDDYDYSRKVENLKTVNPVKYERISEGVKGVENMLAERLDNYGTTSILERAGNRFNDFFRWDVFEDTAYTRNVSNYDKDKAFLEDPNSATIANEVRQGSQATRLASDMSRYEQSQGRAIAWNNSSEQNKFLDYMYRFDTIGKTTTFTRKGEQTFSSVVGDRESADENVKDIGLAFRDEFLSKYKPENPERFSNVFGEDRDMISMEVYPNNKGMKIFFNSIERDLDLAIDDALDAVNFVGQALTPSGVVEDRKSAQGNIISGKYVTQRVDGMWRVFQDDTGDYSFEMLSKEQYEYAMKSPVYRAQLEQEKWRHTTTDGAIEIDTEQFKKLFNGFKDRKARAEIERKQSEYRNSDISDDVSNNTLSPFIRETSQL